MAILDFFKKKKKAKPKKEKKKPSKIELPQKAKKAKKVAKKVPELPSEDRERKEKKISKLAWRVLKGPHVTEKATQLAGKNQYVFKVFPKANKAEIKKAIQDLYGVDVIDVKIIKVPRKRRRLGRISGWKKGYKKAIVKIKKGQKIEVLPR